MRTNYDITVFAPGDDNYETEGLCGPLAVSGEPVAAEEAGGEYCLDFEHPYDAQGKWRHLLPGYTVRAWVQMRVPPDPDDMGSYAASVEVWQIDGTAAKSDRYLYSTRADGSGTKKLKLLPGGLTVTIVKAYAEGRWKVKCKYGSGWVNQAGLDGSTAETEVVPTDSSGLDGIFGVAFRPQLFDIESIERNRDGIQVHAVHASYRLMKNVTRYVTTASVTGVDAAKALLDNCVEPHEFSVYSDIADTRAGAHWDYVNPIEAIMDPEEGYMRRWGAELLRDNFDLYLLHAVGVDRGVTIEAGRNLSGVTVTEDWSSVATHIMPIGEKADGSLLLLPELWVVSGRAANYPQKYIYAFRAQDAVVDSDNPQSTVLNRMRAQAQAMLDAGCDLPALTVDVDVAQVDDPRAAQIVEALEPVLVYDTVRVYDESRGIELIERVIRRETDPIHGRLLRVTLGNSTQTLTGASLASWQIPSGLNGAKIAPETLDGISLKDKTLYLGRLVAELISGDLIQAGTITAGHLAAGAVTAQSIAAVTAEIASITASTVSTNTLAAAFANLFTVVADNIRAGTVTADALDAVMASLVTASVGVLDVDFAHVMDLDAQEAIIRRGEAGSLFIDRLAVTSANMVNAVISRLILVDDSGQEPAYYAVNVGSGGTIELEEVELTQEEIDAGETGDGRPILADTVVAEDISGTNIYGNSAIIADILTDALNAGQITAAEAMIASARIPALYTTAIEAMGGSLNLAANQTIQLLIGVAENIRAWFRFEDRGLIVRKTGSSWSTRTADDGFYIDHAEVSEPVGAFHKELLEVHGLKVGGGDDDIICRRTSSGGWVWTD